MLGDRLPSLPAIRAFEAAARLGSFTAAGRELGTSSASVSYHVRQLEAQLGLGLFRRHPHRVELTEPGAMIAEQASASFAALRASFARAIDADQGRLTLTALPTFATSWLTPRLGRFRERHPAIQVELDVSEVAEDLAGSRYDVAVRNGDGRWPGLRAHALFPSLFVPLCVPGLRDAARGALAEDGSAVPLLGRPDWWRDWYLAGGRAPPAERRFGTRLAAEHLDVAAALAGQGIVIASPILAGAEIEAGRLVPAHDRVVLAGRDFWLVYPVSRQASAKIAAFRDWIAGEADTAREAAAAYIRAARPGG